MLIQGFIDAIDITGGLCEFSISSIIFDGIAITLEIRLLSGY